MFTTGWAVLADTPTIAVGGNVIVVALISGMTAVLVAWIGRPNREQRARTKRIEENTEKTGNGWTDDLGRRLDRMETSLEARIDLNAIMHNEQIKTVAETVARLEGRFDEHIAKRRETTTVIREEPT